MKAHVVILTIIDHDNLGADGVKMEIENVRYPNDCLSPHVLKIETADIGEWSNEHPLNQIDADWSHYFKGIF